VRAKKFFQAAKENPRIFRDGHEGEQTTAGVARLLGDESLSGTCSGQTETTKELRPKVAALRAARLNVEKNQTGFSLARKKLLGEPKNHTIFREIHLFHAPKPQTPQISPNPPNFAQNPDFC